MPAIPDQTPCPSTGATARARDPCTNNFRPPASKHQTAISKLWQVLRPGQLKLLPITHVYMYSMCIGNCRLSWVFQWRLWQWIDGRRALLGTDALRDRYVVFPKSAMICVACCNLIALWHSSLICIFGALPDVCWPRLLEAQLCLTLPSMPCASMRIWRVRAIYLFLTQPQSLTH